MITGPYQVTDDDLERYPELDATDLDAWFLIVNGMWVFVSDKKEGEKMKRFGEALTNEEDNHINFPDINR